MNRDSNAAALTRMQYEITALTALCATLARGLVAAGLPPDEVEAKLRETAQTLSPQARLQGQRTVNAAIFMFRRGQAVSDPSEG